MREQVKGMLTKPRKEKPSSWQPVHQPTKRREGNIVRVALLNKTCVKTSWEQTNNVIVCFYQTLHCSRCGTVLHTLQLYCVVQSPTMWYFVVQSPTLWYKTIYPVNFLPQVWNIRANHFLLAIKEAGWQEWKLDRKATLLRDRPCANSKPLQNSRICQPQT